MSYIYSLNGSQMRTFYTKVSVVVMGWLLAVGTVCAQSVDTDDDNYQSVTSFGVTTNTNAGIIGGFVFRHSKLLPGTLFGKKQFRYISVEAVNVKHPKEIQTQTGTFAGGRFTFGKENYLFVVRPQYGRELTLFKRTADEGIAINAIVAGGPSIGIIKPYYVQIQEGNQTRSVPYSSVSGSGTGVPTAVPIGAGGFFQGFGQSRFTVGLNVKTAVSFELSAFRDNTTGLEIGFLTEVFPQKIIIIPDADNRSFFTSGYITLFFGSKK